MRKRIEIKCSVHSCLFLLATFVIKIFTTTLSTQETMFGPSHIVNEYPCHIAVIALERGPINTFPGPGTLVKFGFLVLRPSYTFFFLFTQAAFTCPPKLPGPGKVVPFPPACGGPALETGSCRNKCRKAQLCERHTCNPPLFAIKRDSVFFRNLSHTFNWHQ